MEISSRHTTSWKLLVSFMVISDFVSRMESVLLRSQWSCGKVAERVNVWLLSTMLLLGTMQWRNEQFLLDTE